MWEHIYEEADRLKELLASRQVADLLNAYDSRKLTRIIFVSSGSSLNITTIAKRFYEELAHIEVNTYTPFDFAGNATILTQYDREMTLIAAISQTGTSSGTIDAIHHAKKLGFNVLTLTETRNTPVEQLGDYYLNFLSGSEPCNAKTKGVCNSLTLLMLLAIEIGKVKGVLGDERYQAYIDEIAASIEDIPATIEAAKQWLENHQDWGKVQHFYVLGNGTNYGTAEEATLKMMETMCIPATVCELGEFSHGVHRTIGPNSNIITIVTEEYGHEIMKKTNGFLAETVGRLLVIDATSEPFTDDNVIHVAHRPLTASCLNLNVALQVLATALPEYNGIDPNQPMHEELTRLVGTRI